MVSDDPFLNSKNPGYVNARSGMSDSTDVLLLGAYLARIKDE